MDARAVVLVLPRSAVLERATEVETRWDAEMERLPRITKAFRSTGKVGKPGSVQERAIEAMSVTFPLVYVGQTEEEDALPAIEDKTLNRLTASGAKLHPYVRTQVQVALVNETRPFDAAKYQQKFKDLKADAVSES